MTKNFGFVVLQIAVALYLLVSGILGLTNSSAGELAPVFKQIKDLFNNASVATFILIFISSCQLVAGLFLIMEFFTTSLKITDMILFIIIILWIVNIILADFIAPFGSKNTFKNVDNILKYLSNLSRDLMVLGGLMVVAKKG